MSPPIQSTPNFSVSSLRASSVGSSVVSKRISSSLSSFGAIRPLSSMTAMTFSSPRENCMMSAGAAIRAIISTGISSVVMIKDFLRTRSLNSRWMMMDMLDMAFPF